MNKQELKNKKELAKALFMESKYTQEEIGDFIGISRVTIGKWIKEGNWEELRTANTITPQKIVYQLSRQIDDINKSILTRPEGERFATAKEADAILKISSTIKNLQKETGLTEVVGVAMSFLNWLREAGEYEKGKDFLKYFNMYINEFAEKKQ